MKTLDDTYGRLMAPLPRSVSGQAYDPWESAYAPASLIRLEVESAETMRALVDHVAAGCPISTTLMNDVIFIWVVDRTGEIFVATEELVLDYLPMWLVKHQTMRLTREENKLGHPSLISCEAGRIGGEIKFLRASQTRKNDLWVINNASGRYSSYPDRTKEHLSNVASRFLSFGMKFAIDFIPPRKHLYIDRLVSYLQLYETDNSAIEEALYILGLRHFSTFPLSVLSDLNEEIRKRVRAPISLFFLSGSSIEETRESRSEGSQLSPPAYNAESRRRLTALLQKIRSADQLVTWRSDLDRFIEFHRGFAEKTGDAYLLVRGFGAASNEILKQNFRNQEASRAIEMLLLEGLRWEPENEHFWGFWAQAYISVGDYTVAEYIFWENLRRHPHNMHGRAMFAEFLASFLGRIDEAIVIARDALSISPDDSVLRSALAKYLLWSDSSESTIEALELFTDSSKVLIGDDYARDVFAKAILKFFESASDPTRFRIFI